MNNNCIESKLRGAAGKESIINSPNNKLSTMMLSKSLPHVIILVNYTLQSAAKPEIPLREPLD